MKNKKLTYLLVPLVLLIWGLIIYKIFTHIKDKNTSGMNKAVQNIAKKEAVRDSFTIVADYRDPFLSGHAVSTEPREPDFFEYQGFSKKTQPVAEERIPELRYYGLIINSKNKKKVGIFSLNNKDLLLSEGESFQEFRILKLYNDSVKTNFRKNKKLSIQKIQSF